MLYPTTTAHDETYNSRTSSCVSKWGTCVRVPVRRHMRAVGGKVRNKKKFACWWLAEKLWLQQHEWRQHNSGWYTVASAHVVSLTLWYCGTGTDCYQKQSLSSRTVFTCAFATAFHPLFIGQHHHRNYAFTNDDHCPQIRHLATYHLTGRLDWMPALLPPVRHQARFHQSGCRVCRSVHVCVKSAARWIAAVAGVATYRPIISSLAK